MIQNYVGLFKEISKNLVRHAVSFFICIVYIILSRFNALKKKLVLVKGNQRDLCIGDHFMPVWLRYVGWHINCLIIADH